MNLKKCANGHYYDGDTYATCPHCQGSAETNDTVALDTTRAQDSVKTVAMTTQSAAEPVTVASRQIEPVAPPTGGSLNDLINMAGKAPTAPQPAADDQKTISFFADNNELSEKDPVVGWLICVKGKMYGEDFRLKSGRNFVGRSDAMDVSLKGEMTVSRDRHAIIVYEPKQNIFLAMPGETKELIYLNGNVVLMPTMMKKNDILQVGDVLLMLVPFCDEAFTWKDAAEL